MLVNSCVLDGWHLFFSESLYLYIVIIYHVFVADGAMHIAVVSITVSLT